jgi:hypothetical protein
MRPLQHRHGRRDKGCRKTVGCDDGCCAAEAAAFAEQMRPIFAELETLSGDRAAIVLNERGVPTPGGVRWSSKKITRMRRRLSGNTHDKTAKALAFAERMRPIMAELQVLSAHRCAAVLNERGIPTAAGRRWVAVQVRRVRQRLARLDER